MTWATFEENVEERSNAGANELEACQKVFCFEREKLFSLGNPTRLRWHIIQKRGSRIFAGCVERAKCDKSVDKGQSKEQKKDLC